MKRMGFFATLVVFCFCLCAPSCGSSEEYADAAPEHAAIEEDVAVGIGAESSVDPQLQKIVRSGNMTVEVDDLAAAKRMVDDLVGRYGGYYGEDGFSRYGNRASHHMAVRVPESRYLAFVDELAGLGEVAYKSIEAADVTEEFVDLSSRLATKKSYLDRYRELLSKASSVKDIIEIEGQVRVLQEEIESTEGRLRYLQDRVSMSTLDLSLTSNEGSRFVNSLRGGWRIFVDIFFGAIYIWPVLVIAGLVVWLVGRRKKRRARG